MKLMRQDQNVLGCVCMCACACEYVQGYQLHDQIFQLACHMCVFQRTCWLDFSSWTLVLQQQPEKDGLSVKHMLGTQRFISDR